MQAPIAASARSFERLISLDAYRQRRKSAHSAAVAMSRLEELRPSLPTNFLEDHRLAFLSSSEHHDARALCLLLNRRPISAGLHHLSALLFRNYAHSDAMSRLSFIWAHLSASTPSEHTVHMNSTIFFRAMVEAFYREHSKEVLGDAEGKFTVVDDPGSILALFYELGYEHRYNAVLETYNSSLHRSDESDQHLSERQNAPVANR